MGKYLCVLFLFALGVLRPEGAYCDVLLSATLYPVDSVQLNNDKDLAMLLGQNTEESKDNLLASRILLGVLFFLFVVVGVILVTRKIKMQKIVLERRVYRRTLEVSRQKVELEKQSEKLQKAYEEIQAKNGAIEEAFQHLTASFAKQKDLNQFKESMTAMIVHDFKNSLNTVISFSGGDYTPRRMKSIHQAGKSMLNMVLNMLDVQKFESAKVELSLSNHYITDVIQNATHQLENVIEQKNIKIIQQVKSELFCRLDFEMCVRVIINVVTNAIKYSPSNSEIIIDTQEKGDFVEVVISDQGPGIPANILGKIFDKYTQFAPKDSGQVKSTGIGLAFCKMAMEAHGGEIKVTSSEGLGANFYLSFPRIEVENGIIIKTEPPAIKQPELDFEHSEMDVLIPILEELKNLEVYDYSDIMEVIDDVNSDHPSLIAWKENMVSALQNVNEEEYLRLISVLENEKN
jgi:signal transduction histidine kinase